VGARGVNRKGKYKVSFFISEQNSQYGNQATEWGGGVPGISIPVGARDFSHL